jgi:hypothetical protein
MYSPLNLRNVQTTSEANSAFCLMVAGVISRGGGGSGSGVILTTHIHPSIADVKNEWSYTSIFGCTMALGSTQPLTEMSTRNIS